ncbi:MAG: hypothetical protein EHM57_08350, partial [Actinobacteria bacterium]
MLDEREIQAIIERVRGRVAAAEAGHRAGPTLRASAELAGGAALGDGVHPTIDAAVAAAAAAFRAYRDLGLEARKTIVESMREAMLREG